MDNSQATAYLAQFIGQPLRIHTSDARVFGGQMKCTDKACTLPLLPSPLLFGHLLHIRFYTILPHLFDRLPLHTLLVGIH